MGLILWISSCDCSGLCSERTTQAMAVMIQNKVVDSEICVNYAGKCMIRSTANVNFVSALSGRVLFVMNEYNIYIYGKEY